MKSSLCDSLESLVSNEVILLPLGEEIPRLQATLIKLLTYCLLRSTQPPTLSGTGNVY